MFDPDLRVMKLSKLPSKQHHRAVCAVLILLLGGTFAGPAQAKKDEAPADSQALLQKGIKTMRGGKAVKAIPVLTESLQTAEDSHQCITIAEATELYGTPLLPLRRKCMERALSLAKTREEYMELAAKSRHFECFDVEKRAVAAVLEGGKTPEDLYDLARKAHQLSAFDVVNESLVKAYSLCKSIPEALNFAKEAQQLGAENLVKEAVKDLIDDETTTHGLMVLLNQVEVFNLAEQNRYLLKKCLDVSNSFDDYVEVAGAARRFGEKDIRDIAVYRAKKRKLLKQLKGEEDQAAADRAAAAQGQGTKVNGPGAEKGSGF